MCENFSGPGSMLDEKCRADVRSGEAAASVLATSLDFAPEKKIKPRRNIRPPQAGKLTRLTGLQRADAVWPHHLIVLVL